MNTKRNSRSKSGVIKLEILTRQGRKNQLPSVRLLTLQLLHFVIKNATSLAQCYCREFTFLRNWTIFKITSVRETSAGEKFRLLEPICRTEGDSFGFFQEQTIVLVGLRIFSCTGIFRPAKNINILELTKIYQYRLHVRPSIKSGFCFSPKRGGGVVSFPEQRLVI